MAEIIAAIVQLIALLVELLFHAMWALADAMVFAVEYLFGKPKDGEQRFSAKRLLIAFVPFAVIITLIIWFLRFLFRAQ